MQWRAEIPRSSRPMSCSSGLSAAEDVYSRPETIKKHSNHHNNASSAASTTTTTTTTMGPTEAADKTFLGGDVSTDGHQPFIRSQQKNKTPRASGQAVN